MHRLLENIEVDDKKIGSILNLAICEKKLWLIPEHDLPLYSPLTPLHAHLINARR